MKTAEQLNLRHLRAFLAVCETGTVTHASQRVHLSQPAITQGISKLESLVASTLFQRSTSGMVPTDAGEIFSARVDRATKQLARGMQAVRRVAKLRAPEGLAHRITMTQLRALVAIGEQGSFLAAARHLGTAQPSLLRTARELEHLTGTELYLKRPRRIELTPAAETLFRTAKLTLHELQQGLDEIRAAKGVDTGRLRIGSLPLSRSAILPSALDRLLDEYPYARVEIVDGRYSDLAYALRLADLDVIVGALRDPVPFEVFRQTTLFDDRLGVFCHPEHKAGFASLNARDLAQCTWIVARPGTPVRDRFDGFFAENGLPPPKKVIETSSLVLLRGLLASRQRLAVMSRTQARDEVRQGTMVELSFDLNDEPRPIGFTIRDDWRPTALQTRFLEILQSGHRGL